MTLLPSEGMSHSAIPQGDLVATLNYFQPPEDGSTPFTYMQKPPPGKPQTNFTAHDIEVNIKDIRNQESLYCLDHDGFAVISSVSESTEKEFTDDVSIQQNYYPEVEKLLLDHISNCYKVTVFEHLVRRSSPGALKGPLRRVHIDQTTASAERRLATEHPDTFTQLCRGRYRIVNVWRPLNGPVVSSPLAFASASTVDDNDVIAINAIYPDVTLEVGGVRFNTNQKWYYLSRMRNDERLLLQCFDSEASKVRSKVRGGRAPHTAFTHPMTPQNAIGRDSIEVRALVFER